jgi:PBP1b-binding outer membrane lipoprotein LpoB
MTGCNSCKSQEVADTRIDLSERWNDTDSRLVAEAIIVDCLNHFWINNHALNTGSKPVVIVGNIRSTEQIAVDTFIADIERAFINTGKIRLVASKGERDTLREKRPNQGEFTRELSADYMMTGQIHTIKDHEGDKQVVFYQIDLTLTNIETTEKVWIGQKKIKKFVADTTIKQATRVDADTIIDLSGRWNDTDSRFVAAEMIDDCLTHPWINEHVIDTGRKPVVIFANIWNKSQEHIPVATFITDIERAFINTGKVRVVSSVSERNALRKKRVAQAEFAALETVKWMERELGADYIMTGEIKRVEEHEEGKQVISYQTDLALTNIETNNKVWIGQKKIKKFIEQNKLK